MSDPTDRKSPNLSALQAMIDAVPTAPARDATEDEAAFAAFVNEKLLDANAPQVLMDTMTDMAAKLEGRYDVTDPADIVILNNKLTYLIDITQDRPDPEAPLEPQMLAHIREIMRTKA